MGKWVYFVKNDIKGKEKWGMGKKMGIDCGETFSTTANLTSVRVLVHKAIQEGLLLHQMDVKNSYLHAPIDCEIAWVDDLIIAASNGKIMRYVKEMLSEKFKMKDLGELKHFLGIDFTQSDGCVKMSRGHMSIRYWRGLTCQTVNPEKLPLTKNCVTQKML